LGTGTVTLGTGGATLAQVREVAEGASVELGPDAREAIAEGRRRIEEIFECGRPVYGVNTGFGRLAGTVVPCDEISQLQVNLLRSHACGTGSLLDRETARVTMFLRLASLAAGRSGIRPETAGLLEALLNSDLYPAVPSKGSLGASGDLAPLAHMCLPLIGEGECIDPSGRLVPGAEALSRLGREPIVPGAKEGLALINGTQLMTAFASLTLLRADEILEAADTAATMSLEVLLGTTAAFDPEFAVLRPHPGMVRTIETIHSLIEGSGILTSHSCCPRVQDAYSLRCVPQVHGAVRDALAYVRGVIERELVSVTDNPLLLSDGSLVSGGNFHGEPVAFASDHMKLALSEMACISERRTERLLNPDLSGLPAFLSPAAGTNSGYMIAQYTAASLVSENRVLAHPASVDSIPVSGSQEDHVSMGTTAARQAFEISGNTLHVIATELVCAAQAYEFMSEGIGHGRGTHSAYSRIREVVPPLAGDRQFDAEIGEVAGMVLRGNFRREALLGSQGS
jgi:histidine ammonia-lyase